MASPDASKQSWTQNITPYLVYLSLITAMGPIHFGFHLVPSLSPPYPSPYNLPNC